MYDSKTLLQQGEWKLLATFSDCGEKDPHIYTAMCWMPEHGRGRGGGEEDLAKYIQRSTSYGTNAWPQTLLP